ncbi:sec14 domain containing protein [Cryptosporidium ryanae]|uniref:sec14 domain containing protein n=1 Tax=Cryptosporidium ryanae TaxID=515981 RepID=UPI00351A3870|nr:sec14 domain containing protein [Cryptosporidium ryanae]
MHKSKPTFNVCNWNNSLAANFIYNPLDISEKIDKNTMPSEILFFKPIGDDVFTIFHQGSHNEFKIRQIFLNVELLDEEKKMLIEFDEYLELNKIILPEFMRSLSLRVLMFNKRRYEHTYITKTMSHIMNMFQWRVVTYPLSDMEVDLRRDLESGMIYWYGRDYCLRPIIVIKISKITKHYPLERFIRLIVFCMEWGMRYLMCPGKVETCLALIDIRGVSLTSFPISTMSEISSLLTNQYSFRLYRMFVLHDSLFIQAMWNLTKQFLTDLQQHKIILSRNDIRSHLFKMVHPCQVEEQFGGTQKNRTFPFYPFVFPKGPFVDPNIHPPNGFTRFILENKNNLPEFNRISNCHLLFNKYNVLGKLVYGKTENTNNGIVFDVNGINKLRKSVLDNFNIDLSKSGDNYNNGDNYNGDDINLIISDLNGSDFENCNKKENYFNHKEEETESKEKLESETCFQVTNSDRGLEATNTLTLLESSKDCSRERKIGIINTININSDIASIGDRSQHFIREYSVKSDNNLSVSSENSECIQDLSSNFDYGVSVSNKSSEYLEENLYLEELKNSLIIENQCYDQEIFRSFGVLPITSENLKFLIRRENIKKKNKNNLSFRSSNSNLEDVISHQTSICDNSLIRFESAKSNLDSGENLNQSKKDQLSKTNANNDSVSALSQSLNSYFSSSSRSDNNFQLSSLKTSSSCSNSSNNSNSLIEEIGVKSKISRKKRIRLKIYRAIRKLRSSKILIDEDNNELSKKYQNQNSRILNRCTL